LARPSLFGELVTPFFEPAASLRRFDKRQWQRSELFLNPFQESQIILLRALGALREVASRFVIGNQ
jgi:hypothetical protein